MDCLISYYLYLKYLDHQGPDITNDTNVLFTLNFYSTIMCNFLLILTILIGISWKIMEFLGALSGCGYLFYLVTKNGTLIVNCNLLKFHIIPTKPTFGTVPHIFNFVRYFSSKRIVE